MKREIAEFVNWSRIATICYVKNGLPYCFNCLYAVIPGTESIVFKSSKSSLHSPMMQDETSVAGTIYHASKSGFNNTGVQFNGKIVMNDEMYINAKSAYYKRFPMTLLMSGQLLTITFNTIKFSQTINGISSKMDWQRILHN